MTARIFIQLDQLNPWWFSNGHEILYVICHAASWLAAQVSMTFHKFSSIHISSHPLIQLHTTEYITRWTIPAVIHSLCLRGSNIINICCVGISYESSRSKTWEVNVTNEFAYENSDKYDSYRTKNSTEKAKLIICFCIGFLCDRKLHCLRQAWILKWRNK